MELRNSTVQQKRNALLDGRAAAPKRVRETTANPEIFVEPHNPPACMDGLPDELVLNIFQNLSDVPLAQLRLTSKRYLSIATECQYGHLEYPRSDTEIWDIVTTIIKVNPDLGKHVKSLATGEPWRDDNEPEDWGWARDGQARHDLSTALRLVKNVKQLEIKDFMDMKAERNNIAKDHVWIEVSDEAVVNLQSPGGLGIMDVISVFKLPSVENLELHRFTQPLPMAHWNIPKSSCNVNDLRLEECVIHDTALEQISGSLTALRTFAYDECAANHSPSTDNNDPRSHKVDTSWSKIMKALDEHRRTLEAFHPRVLTPFDPVVRSQWYPDSQPMGVLPSLKGFTKLGKIAVALDILLDLDAKETNLGDKLPSGVEYLDLTMRAYDEHHCQLYSQALSTLQSGVFTGDKKLLRIRTQGYHVYLREMNLSSAIDTLIRAGITVDLQGYGHRRYKDAKSNWTVDELRTLEALHDEGSDGPGEIVDDDDDSLYGDDSEHDTEASDIEYANTIGPEDDGTGSKTVYNRRWTYLGDGDR